MKLIKILAMVCSIFIVNLCFAEQETAPLTTVNPIKEVEVEEIKAENLSTESMVGSLAEYVKEDECLLDAFVARIKKHKLLYPFSEGVAYVNGELCHIGNYPKSIIYTVMEGPRYGLQTVTTYNGMVLYVNYDYVLEYTPFGVILHHEYDDSTVDTGANQVIIFH